MTSGRSSSRESQDRVVIRRTISGEKADPFDSGGAGSLERLLEEVKDKWEKGKRLESSKLEDKALPLYEDALELSQLLPEPIRRQMKAIMDDLGNRIAAIKARSRKKELE